jgi:hypothetical protein
MNPHHIGIVEKYRPDLQNCGEFSCHVLDEIIDEKLTNTDFIWTGKYGIASFLGVDMNLKAVKEFWNRHKILFAPIAPDTRDSDPAICQITRLGPQGKRCLHSGGCRLPVEQVILFQHLYPERTIKLNSDFQLEPRIQTCRRSRREPLGQ